MSEVNSALRLLIVVGILFSASVNAVSANPKRIVLLQSNGQDFKPWSEYAKAFRQELERQAFLPIAVQSFPISIGSDSERAERQLVAYLNELFPDNALPDLIVTFGAPAAAFVQRNRAELFPATPLLLAAIDQRRVRDLSLTENDAVVPVWIDIPALFENILQILPQTKTIAVVTGNSPNDKFWVEEIKSRLESLSGRVELRFLNELSFEEVLKQTANLPKNSAIFWVQPQVDASGATHEGESALRRLYATANAPIFSHDDAFFNGEIVGGPMTSVTQGSRVGAAVAVRILAGEKPGQIATPALQYGPAKFDWRELNRWNISESLLPKPNEVLFRRPSAWEVYRWQVLAVSAAILIQAALIIGLLYERRRRLLAEVESRQRMAELAHINRYSMAGELTASIAHELNQPLGAILVNAETLEEMLRAPTLDVAELREITSEIRRDDQRAGRVIEHIRSLVKKVPIEVKQLDLNDVARDTLAFLSSLAIARQVQVRHVLAQVPLPIMGDSTQLQQVLLNLIVNALDATADKPISERVIIVRTERSEGWIEFSTSDSGPGIPPDKLKEVFEPFFSTKPSGMGMGLSIARTIVESHGGTIVAQNQTRGGATISVKLPVKL
jgi:signal transduction histidine kinase